MPLPHERSRNHKHGADGQEWDANYLCAGLDDDCPNAHTHSDQQSCSGLCPAWWFKPHEHAGTDCSGGAGCPAAHPVRLSRVSERITAAEEAFAAVKDSGQRRDFDTGSRRDVAVGKGRYDLLPPLVIRRLAQHFENGAAKYGDHNWRKGQPLSVYLDSGLRHGFNVLELQQDEDHVAAAIWNFAAFMWTAEQIKLGALPAKLDDIGWHQTIDSVGPTH